MARSKENPANLKRRKEAVSEVKEPETEATEQLDELVDLLLAVMFDKQTEQASAQPLPAENDLKQDSNTETETAPLPPLAAIAPEAAVPAETLQRSKSETQETAGERPHTESNVIYEPSRLLAPAKEKDGEKLHQTPGSSLDGQEAEPANLGEQSSQGGQPLEAVVARDESESARLSENGASSQEEADLALESLASLLFFPEKIAKPAEAGAFAFESNDSGKPQNSSELAVQQDADDLGNPLEQLQTLLFGSRLNEIDEFKSILLDSELPAFRSLIALIDNKLAQVERQIYDPQELKSLLLPWIAEILSLKVSESKQEVVNAIFPIIDEVIRFKSQEDKQAMSAAIADLLPDAISQQITNSPEQLAKALAPEIGAAIKEQIRLEQDAIATAIAPAMGQAIKAQIELERDAMVDALYPVIGNTISKYMVETIREINEKITNTFSYEGVRRKIRSKMQGVSEAELILRESVPFTVAAVFLIHKSSGLVISEVQRDDNHRLESEMVAGMLTAIRSFVNDCIAQSGEISELNEIEYGDSKIILEVAGYCYLSAAIKGEPPKEFIDKLRKTLGTIVLKYGKPVERFDGDPSEIPESVQELLEALMQFSLQKKDKKPPTALMGIAVALSSLILIPWGIDSYRKNIEWRIESATANALASVPELAVYRLGVDAENNTLKLTGNLPNQQLRAKAEAIALRATPDLKVENKIVAVDVPPDPAAVAAEVKRVTDLLNQMQGVSISTRYQNRKVTVEGTAIESGQGRPITQAFQQIPGVQSVASTLTVKPLAIDSRIYFDVGSSALNPAYRPVIVKIQELLNRYPQKSLKIIGHADRQGNPAINQKLALARAEAVRVALLKRGIAPGRLQVAGKVQPPSDVGSSQPQFLSRCVLFELMTQPQKSQKRE